MDGSRRPNSPIELADQLIQSALAEGFALAGVVDVELAALTPHTERYDAWLKQGFAGNMQYLERGRDRRADIRQVYAHCQSVLSVAIPYTRVSAGASEAFQGPLYARYLNGPDYHRDLAERLERTMSQVNLALIESGTTPVGYKICVDTSAILERSWAQLAGLGWIGKNTMLIHPKLGSYLFLAEVLLDRATGRAPAPLPDLCGHCRRCLDACPTNALVEPKSLDSRKCIAYLTLEERGKISQPPPTRWIAGCDICQEVCPFNQKPVRNEQQAQTEQSPTNTSATGLHEWSTLLSESTEEYRERVRDSALKRVKPAQFSRNLAWTLVSSWREATPLLQNQMRVKLGKEIEKKYQNELDPIAREAWADCRKVILEGAPLA